MSQKSIVETALEAINPSGLVPGTVIPVGRFEEVFGVSRATQEFGFLITGIRRALYPYGLYLSGEGMALTGGYTILHPRDNFWIAKLAMARAERDLSDKQVLLLNTKLDGLSTIEKARHEATLHTMSLRLSALRRVRDNNAKIRAQRKELLGEGEED
jgi:hypothetical protein